MENKERKIGTATIDINEYDRLMKLENDLIITKEKGYKSQADVCEFFIKLIHAFEDSHIINPANNDFIMLDKMVYDAGYTIKINLPSGDTTIGGGKKLMVFSYV